MTEPSQRLSHFVAGDQGPWLILNDIALVGEALPRAKRLQMSGPVAPERNGAVDWHLQGMTSHDRYVTREEKRLLIARQPEPGRPGASLAAFIGLRKNPQWWALTQDERRDVIEGQSRHIAIGMRYLPAIARRLFHCRDLATPQPFDFLTWFEYAPEDAQAFDELLGLLRASAEWQFVEREVDLRMRRVDE
ncbi:chlorite dismutase [Pseudomonas sp. NPDC090202]|uniref:chlorite dismutase n=1 Tax=unclassified Pseudomonas TaxID=196821 RepID=UPI003803A9E1